MDRETDVLYSEIGRRIRARRVELRLTQEKLAEMAGISASFVGHLERAEKTPSVDTLARLCVCMKLSMDYLVMGKRQACDREACALYEDLQRVLASHSSGRMERR